MNILFVTFILWILQQNLNMVKYLRLILEKLKFFGKKKEVNTGDTGLDQSNSLIKYFEDPTFEIEGYFDNIYYTNGFYFIKTINGKYIYYRDESVEKIKA
jgi:hypothetical protein